ncbi:MAG TPA: zinc ribbon domain-containing protein [Burkholderiaceae bacterium]|nr:zinc ribbon domain-containing protein [Burkholderiaceae bacterium]HQR69351.1 zinc ribbon domain-containing protein [Burkholderiaceae bacterium]
MPIYAYRCGECAHEFDVLQKVSEAPLTDCPACGRPALVKKITAAGFQLKGSGWYVTDFRDAKSAKKDAAKADTPADGKTPGGDVKPDTAKPADGAASVSKPAEAAPATPPSPAGGTGGPSPAS